MKDMFEPSEIEVKVYPDDSIKDVINRTMSACNEKLNKLIESWIDVYTETDKPNRLNSAMHSEWTTCKSNYSKYSARLAFIEPIKRECVKHEATVNTIKIQDGVWSVKCLQCGVDLVAEWKEKT